MAPRNDCSVTFHIGYHKTATTWMQKRLFLAQNGFQVAADHVDVFEHVVKPNPFYFDPEALRARIVKAQEAAGPQDSVIISSELLVGHPYDGARGGDVYARRLKEIWPEARILVSIRTQLKMLPSVYMHHVAFGGTQHHADFFAGPKEIEHFGFDPHHFEYDRLIGLYHDLFGAENVMVVPQEALLSDMEQTARNIAGFTQNSRFAGLDAKAMAKASPSYPEYAAPVLRRINHFQRSPLNPAPLLPLGTRPGLAYRGVGYLARSKVMRRLIRSQKPVSDYVKAHFAGTYAESNERLRALLDPSVDLSAY